MSRYVNVEWTTKPASTTAMATKVPVIHGRDVRQVSARARHRKSSQTNQFNAKAMNHLLGINTMQTSPGPRVAKAQSQRHGRGWALDVRITDTRG